jgi:hypothetical protein
MEITVHQVALQELIQEYLTPAKKLVYHLVALVNILLEVILLSCHIKK